VTPAVVDSLGEPTKGRFLAGDVMILPSAGVMLRMKPNGPGLSTSGAELRCNPFAFPSDTGTSERIL
jgi:hypothetical protein